MSKDFELNYEGVGQLLKSQEMQQECQNQASKLVSSRGRDYFTSARNGSSRVRVEIRANSVKTWRHNKKSSDWSEFL